MVCNIFILFPELSLFSVNVFFPYVMLYWSEWEVFPAGLSIWMLGSCLSQGFYSCTNTKKQVGEERVYSAYTSTLLFTKGSQDWNSSRSGSRSWCRGHEWMCLNWLASPGLLSLLSYRTQVYQPREMVPPTRGLSCLITNWENALQLDLVEAFLKLFSLW